MIGDLLLLETPSGEMSERFTAFAGIRMQRVLQTDIELDGGEGKYAASIWYADRDPYGFHPIGTFNDGHYLLCPNGMFFRDGLNEIEAINNLVQLFDTADEALSTARRTLETMHPNLKPDCIAALSLVRVDEGLCAELREQIICQSQI